MTRNLVDLLNHQARTDASAYSHDLADPAADIADVRSVIRVRRRNRAMAQAGVVGVAALGAYLGGSTLIGGFNADPATPVAPPTVTLPTPQVPDVAPLPTPAVVSLNSSAPEGMLPLSADVLASLSDDWSVLNGTSFDLGNADARREHLWTALIDPLGNMYQLPDLDAIYAAEGRPSTSSPWLAGWSASSQELLLQVVQVLNDGATVTADYLVIDMLDGEVTGRLTPCTGHGRYVGKAPDGWAFQCEQDAGGVVVMPTNGDGPRSLDAPSALVDAATMNPYTGELVEINAAELEGTEALNCDAVVVHSPALGSTRCDMLTQGESREVLFEVPLDGSPASVLLFDARTPGVDVDTDLYFHRHTWTRAFGVIDGQWLMLTTAKSTDESPAHTEMSWATGGALSVIEGVDAPSPYLTALGTLGRFALVGAEAPQDSGANSQVYLFDPDTGTYILVGEYGPNVILRMIPER